MFGCTNFSTLAVHASKEIYSSWSMVVAGCASESRESKQYSFYCLRSLFSPPPSTFSSFTFWFFSIYFVYTLIIYYTHNLIYFSCCCLHFLLFHSQLSLSLSLSLFLSLFMEKTSGYPYYRQNYSKRGFSRNCRFKLPKGSELTIRYLKNLADKVARALQSVTTRKRQSPKDSSSIGRSNPAFVAPVDSHRTEAIEDCIEFINSSSSFSRSNSVTANS